VPHSHHSNIYTNSFGAPHLTHRHRLVGNSIHTRSLTPSFWSSFYQLTPSHRTRRRPHLRTTIARKGILYIHTSRNFSQAASHSSYGSLHLYPPFARSLTSCDLIPMALNYLQLLCLTAMSFLPSFCPFVFYSSLALLYLRVNFRGYGIPSFVLGYQG